MDAFKLPDDIRTALLIAGVDDRVHNLATMTDKEILRIPNIGRKQLDIIREALAAVGYKKVNFNKLPWLHVGGQYTWHSPAYVVGTHEGLTALRDALNEALEKGVSKAAGFASDGEGFHVDVVRTMRSLMGEPPYIRKDVERELEFEYQYEQRRRRMCFKAVVPKPAQELGQRGGKARAIKLSPERRSEIASEAAKRRWQKCREKREKEA